jgi:phenylalanyl-tRNA synthetase beta chain
MSGNEVASIERQGDWENVFIGQIVAVEQHPSAKHLMVATIDLGMEKLTVVCGAPNLRIGDKVPVARPGARLIDAHTNEFTILKPVEIHGIRSEGMACSEKELGISDSHEGLMILPQDAPVGTPLSQYLGDAIFDIEVTPNRPDCLSIIGIAREVAALTRQKVSLPEVRYEEEEPAIEETVSVEIADAELCTRYCASLINDIKVSSSPPWLKERLITAGLRPVNNIVDITNYVMLEYGQPLHAFDFRQIRGGKIIVRRALNEENLTTLDGVERALNNEILIIADEQSPIALAGVMGGALTEVTDNTTSVLLEAAKFDSGIIRRTRTKLGLPTEASTRFEKALSPELPPLALCRATQLIVQLAGGKAARGIIDLYPIMRKRSPIPVSQQKVCRVLGMQLSMEQIMEVLDRLGFAYESLSPSEILVTCPYWRTDIAIADDIVEEVARIIGYNELPTATLSGELPEWQPAPFPSLRERVRDILVGCGIQEVITYSLTSLSTLERVDPGWQIGHPLRVANPLTREQEYLRTNLRANLLSAYSANEKRWENDIQLFEIGKVYLPRKDDLPEEREILAGILGRPQQQRLWRKVEQTLDFFTAKGILETLFNRLGIRVHFEPTEVPILLPGRTAKIVIDNETVGLVGEIHPKIAKSFDISSPSVSFFELDLQGLLPFTTQAPRYYPLPRFPSTVRDIALVVDAEMPAGRIQDIIQSFPLVSQATIFDIYQGEQVPQGKKSLAFSIRYQSPLKTLTDDEVNQAQQEILQRLNQEFGATLRE